MNFPASLFKYRPPDYILYVFKARQPTRAGMFLIVCVIDISYTISLSLRDVTIHTLNTCSK